MPRILYLCENVRRARVPLLARKKYFDENVYDKAERVLYWN